ncbi:hypothetical protein B0H34DRAFT_731948 [Crassisporium funariophilum]|nr:hypothetical protein B0H34DRAFT_731948 [Crassisporium funariophilum]
MMMRYVGTGVGHCQSADFPREDGQLKKALTGDSYVQTAGQEGNESGSIHSAPANPSLDEGNLDEEEEYDFGNGDEDDNDSFDEEMYEM